MWAGIADDIATHYGQDGPGIESQWGRDFMHLSSANLPESYSMGFGDSQV